MSVTGAWEDRARFCPLCGGGLERRQVEERQRPVCGPCGLILYLNPAAAAAAVVLRGREVLLIRRNIRPYRGHWALPAGYEEYDESPVETAVRETAEETGLRVRPLGLYDVLYTCDDPRKRGILVVYLCELEGGELEPGDDADEARFFALDALPEQIGFVNNQRILERLRREVEQGGPRLLPFPEQPGGATDQPPP